MTECSIIGGAQTPEVRRAVTVESIGSDSAVVRQFWYEGDEQLQEETRFASLSEALAYASQLCKVEDSPEEIELLDS